MGFRAKSFSLGLCGSFAFLTFFCLPTLAYDYPPLVSTKGMVASDNPIASAVGRDILKAGGNATDAAIATALALGVLQPFASGIGAGGFMLVRDVAKEAPVTTPNIEVIDYRETAPAKASRDMFIRNGKAVPELSQTGGLSIAVPGEIKGFYLAHQRHGKLPWAKVIAPAQRLAERGATVGPLLSKILKVNQKEILASPTMLPIFAPRGKLLSEGDFLQQPQLGKTLSLVAQKGPDGFYQGKVAQGLVKDVQGNGGILSEQDLARYEAKVRKPIQGQYRGLALYMMPPPSSGGAILIEILNILEGYNLGPMGQNSSASLHLITEAMKHSFSDRAQVMGDTDFVNVPLDKLTDKAYAASLRKRIDQKTKAPESYGGFNQATAATTDHGTTHLSVADGQGNVVAMTNTINLSFGSKLLSPSTGVLLNDEMDDFSAQPGVPNAFGLVGNAANAIAPGKRPLSSMSPTLVFKQGKPYLILGASGGPMIITATLQTFLNVVDYGLEVRAAVESPRIHHQWKPNRISMEKEFPLDVVDGLKQRGHEVKMVDELAAVQIIEIKDGKFYGASDPRKLGFPAGY
jgi:gamma-glutamyltranspeptidase / glutathione hydrolase